VLTVFAYSIIAAMEVVVVKLRRHGEKIPRDELDAQPRVRGFMAIHYWRLKDGRVDMTIKELILLPHEGANCNPILLLNAPDQTRLDGMDMVYVGTEKIDGVEYPQAWWVKCDPRPAGNGVIPYDRDYATAGKRALS